MKHSNSKKFLKFYDLQRMWGSKLASKLIFQWALESLLIITATS